MNSRILHAKSPTLEDNPMNIKLSIPVAVLTILGGHCLFAEDPITTHPANTGPGWQELFEPDLSNADYKPGVWTFADGELTATADEVIWTDQEFGDCILDLEFRTDPGANSGVIVYASDTGNWIPNSVEVQITDDHAEEWARAPKTWQCGAIFGRLAPTESRVKQPGEWNRYTIQCAGKTIRVLLNDALVTNLDMSKWTDAKKNPDGSEIPEWLSRPLADLKTRGHIGLQGKHAGAAIYFRHLRIKTTQP